MNESDRTPAHRATFASASDLAESLAESLNDYGDREDALPVAEGNQIFVFQKGGAHFLVEVSPASVEVSGQSAVPAAKQKTAAGS